MHQLKKGRIVKIISNLYTVKTEEENLNCRACGKFRQQKITPLVGDICKIDSKNNYIMEIEPRKNALERPAIANIDAALIVTSVKEPTINYALLDKMIALISFQKIEPILIFTKLDLLTKEEYQSMDKILNYYQKIGYPVFLNDKIEKIKKHLKGKYVVVTGQTGAGKSTLLNKMNKNLSLKTDTISYALGRGKHTTRHVEFFPFNDFFVADTPGFSKLDFKNMTEEGIKNSFIEFKNYPCPFKNCRHEKEQVCGVKEAVAQQKILNSRYQSYLEFIKNK